MSRPPFKSRKTDSKHVDPTPTHIEEEQTTRFIFLCDEVRSPEPRLVAPKMCVTIIEAVDHRLRVCAPLRGLLLQNVLRDDGVVRQLHLVDRDGVGLKLDRASHCLMPLLFSLTHHARDEIDIDLREVDFAGPLVSAIDLR